MNIQNKRVVITGATSGIGLQLCKKLLPDNEVIVISKDSKKLETLERENTGVITYQADLSDPESLDSLVKTIADQYSRIDILINNAAIQHIEWFTDENFEYEGIMREISVNFTSVCCLCYLFLPLLKAAQNAVILNVNSGLAVVPKTSSAVYCACKSAMNSFSQSLRNQLESTSIQVHQVFLDLVDTQMTEGRGHHKISPELAAELIITGVQNNQTNHDIGKVKMLRLLSQIAPSIALKIMKKH